MESISRNPNITGDIISKNPKKWDFICIKKSKYKIRISENNPDKEWDMYHLSINSLYQKRGIYD